MPIERWGHVHRKLEKEEAGSGGVGIKTVGANPVIKILWGDLMTTVQFTVSEGGGESKPCKWNLRT